MARRLIRTWRLMETEDLAKHLLIVGELTGECANCKQVGLDYRQVKQCPQCGSEFQYVTSRQSSGAFVTRLITARADLMAIEYDDYKSGVAVDKTRGLFG